MFTEAQNFAIVQTELDSVFYQNWDGESFPGYATAETGAIFKPLNTDHAAYIEEIFKGSGLFPSIGETSTVPLSTPKVTNKITTYIKDYANSIELSKNLFDDNMHGVYSRMIADFAMVARKTQEDNAFAFFRGAFTTSLTADGSAFIASRTLINGQTLTNVISGALTPDTLNDAVVALAQMKNQAGVIMGSIPAVLLVPPKLFKHAREITDSALIADSGNNNINVYRSAFGFEVWTSPYLSAAAGGSDTAWFLLGKNHSVTRLIRQGIQTALRDWTYSNNRTYLYQANFRETVYAPDYVGAVGSTGL
jgi:phage major head subunit gpT-like protein